MTTEARAKRNAQKAEKAVDALLQAFHKNDHQIDESHPALIRFAALVGKTPEAALQFLLAVHAIAIAMEEHR